MKNKIIYTLVALFGLGVAQGQQQTDSLLQYLEIAAKNNPTVLQRYNEYQAAMQKIPQVGSLPDPELSLGVFLSPMEIIAGNQVADIRLMQMFPWFGVLMNAKDEMSLMAQAKYESFRDAKLQVFYDVQRSWYNLYQTQQNIRVSEKNIAILQTLERLALVKFKTASSTSAAPSAAMQNNKTNNQTSSSAGGMNAMGTASQQSNKSNPQSSSLGANAMASSSDGASLSGVYQIQMDIGDLENTIAQLQSQQNTNRARFNSYLNRLPQTPFAIPDSLPIDSLKLVPSAVSDSMLLNSPMLGMLQYEQQSLDARKKMLVRMSYPMVGIGVNYSVINKSDMSTSPMNGKDMIMPMLTVTLPIYRKKYKAQQTETDLMKTSVEQAYKATTNSLQTEYYEALQLFTDAERRMKLFERQNILAQKNFEIMMRNFSSSTAGLSDVLRIRQQMYNYEYKRIEALVDYNTAIAWLQRLGNVQIIK